MTLLSPQWRAARPQRWTAVIRRPWAVRRRVRPGRRPYRDSFFADPALVEDDARRMTPRGAPAR